MSDDFPGPVAAITLFVEDLAETRRFYTEVFALPVHYEDPHSVVFAFADLLVNLLHVDQAPELVTPAPVGAPSAGVRSVLTVPVEDVDRVCALLVERGVELLNGPQDRPWGVRTASFRDPSGHVWEIAH